MVYRLLLSIIHSHETSVPLELLTDPYYYSSEGSHDNLGRGGIKP